LAVARLSKVILKVDRKQFTTVLLKLMQFGEFHPSKTDGYVQDIGLLILVSKAQTLYARANELLARSVKIGENLGNAGAREEFKASNIEDLLTQLEDFLNTLQELIWFPAKQEEREQIVHMLRSIREASLNVFNNLSKIVVLVAPDQSISLAGYIPTSTVKQLKQELSDYVISAHPLDRRESNDPYVPSLLVNPRVVSLFETLTLDRGIPKYNEIDPTPIVAFVFPAFFGIMFGDLGHGMALLAFGVYLVKKTKYNYWGRLIIVLGVSAAIVGIIRGSFFGVVFASPLQKLVPLPPSFSAEFTLSSIPLLLEIAIIVGSFHLASAYAFAFLNNIRSFNYADAFLNRLPTFVLYVAIVPFGLAVAGTGLQLQELYTSKSSTPVFSDLLGVHIPIWEVATYTAPVVVVCLIILAIGYPVKNYLDTHSLRKPLGVIGYGIIEALTRPFEFFMNTLSYVRLGVLLITTTLLGSLIAGALVFGVPGVLLAVFLNLIIMAMEGLIVYIQDMRLHLYEWLSKFYVGTGTPFAPLLSKGQFSSIVVKV
jgi:V/A-type H+/Na+-transporting ATPase subunit I